MNRRSQAMAAVLEHLVCINASQAWLGSKLNPPVRRQTVSGWHDVPEHYVTQVADLLGLDAAVVRPDLARLFAKKKTTAVVAEVSA